MSLSYKDYKKILLAVVGVIVLPLMGSVPVGAAPGGQNTTLVNCNAGKSIGDALANGATEIEVRGVCDERIDITTSNVTIRGKQPGDGIAYTADTQTAVLIKGAQNVVLENLTVSGPRRAVNVFAGGAAFFVDSDFSSTTPNTHASFVGDNSFANITRTTIEGLLVFRNGGVRLFGSTIDSPGAGAGNVVNISMNLNGGSAFVWGSQFNGHVSVNWLSRVNFGRFFNGFDWGPSSITNDAGTLPDFAMQCNGYSVIFASPAKIVQDGAGNPLTSEDVAAPPECQLIGIPVPPPAP